MYKVFVWLNVNSRKSKLLQELRMHMHQEIQTLQKEPSIFGNGSEWPYGWVFVYDLSVSGFESSCIHLNIRYRACFEQGVPWHSGNYRVWIHPETRTWHDKNVQSNNIYNEKNFKVAFGTKCFKCIYFLQFNAFYLCIQINTYLVQRILN